MDGEEVDLTVLVFLSLDVGVVAVVVVVLAVVQLAVLAEQVEGVQ